MRKLTILGLSLLLILGLTACDLNIFSSFDTPVFSAEELNESMQDIESNDEDGTVDEEKVIEQDSPTGVDETPPKVSPAAKNYVSQIEEMVENDTLDDFAEGGDTDELTKIADNLDSIVSGVLSGLNIELDDETSPDDTKTFEELVTESFGAASDEEIQELRNVIQSTASAAVSVRLEADPDSRDLVSNTTLLLLDLLGSDESRSIARELTYDREYDIPDRLQFRFVSSDDTEYVMHFFIDETGVLADEEGPIHVYFEEVASGDYSTVFDVGTDGNSADGYVLPIGDAIGLEDEPAGNDELVAFLELIEGMVVAEGVGIPYLRADGRLQALEDFMAGDAEDSEGGEDTGGDDQSISGLFSMLEDNNIDITKLNKIATTYNGIAKSSRAFAATLEYTDETKTEIDLASVAPMFKERTGNALNGKGFDMVTMSVLSIVFDYLFVVDEADNRGLFDAAAFHGFLNNNDLISFEDEGDYSIMRLRYIPEMVPGLLDYNSETNATEADLEVIMEDLKDEMLVEAGILADSDTVEASVRLSRDAARLDKLALLISLDVSSMTDGEAATFEELIENMFADDSAGGVE